jgi:hypothetical protein
MQMRWIAPCRASGTSTGVAVCVALLAASSSGYAQGGWTFTTIDDPAAITGTNGTVAQGINDPGQVVGYLSDSTGTHGFSKTGSSFTTLNYPGAPLSSFAEGINNRGDVVGWYNVMWLDITTKHRVPTVFFIAAASTPPSMIHRPPTLLRRALTTKIKSSDFT